MWWCSKCEREVHPQQVKFDETHDFCLREAESIVDRLSSRVAELDILLREAQDSEVTYSRCPECGRLVACSGVPCRAGHCACGYNVTESEIETVDVVERVAELEAREKCVLTYADIGWYAEMLVTGRWRLTMHGEASEYDTKDEAFAILTELGLWPVKGE